MRDPDAPSDGESIVAYLVSFLGTLLWVACVIPSGPLVDPALLEDLATPLYRSAVLVVPALLLLIAGPVGVTIARGAGGQRGVLAATDTFVCGYAAIAILERGRGQGPTYWALAGAMLLLGLLSAIETARYLRAGARGEPPPRVRGLRLAVALLVLLTPSWFLLEQGHELASLLVPFAFVGVSAGGARLARTVRGLRLTSAVLHVLLASHLLVTLRYTIFAGDPQISEVRPPGWAVIGIAALILLLALSQVSRLARAPRAGAEAPA